MLQNSRKMNRINRALSAGSIAIGRSYWTLGTVEERMTNLRCQKSRRRAQQPSGHKYKTFARLGPDKIGRAMRKVGESVRKNDPVTVLSLHQEAPSLKSYIWKSPYGPMETPLTQSTGKIDSDKPSLLRATYMLSLARPHTRSPDHFYRPATRRRYWSETEWSLTFRRIHPHHP